MGCCSGETQQGGAVLDCLQVIGREGRAIGDSPGNPRLSSAREVNTGGRRFYEAGPRFLQPGVLLQNDSRRGLPTRSNIEGRQGTGGSGPLRQRGVRPSPTRWERSRVTTPSTLNSPPFRMTSERGSGR